MDQRNCVSQWSEKYSFFQINHLSRVDVAVFPCSCVQQAGELLQTRRPVLKTRCQTSLVHTFPPILVGSRQYLVSGHKLRSETGSCLETQSIPFCACHKTWTVHRQVGKSCKNLHVRMAFFARCVCEWVSRGDL